jgi:putative tricarboxylic transport membrane protein
MNGASGPSLESAFDALLLIMGCAVAYVSWGYGFGSLSRPGPGLYPFVIGVAIVLFSCLTLISHLNSSARDAVLDRADRKTFLLMTVTFCFWILAMPLLGYVAVTLIATYAFCKAMNLEGWRKPLAVAGGTALFIYVLFDYWLYIDLPRGIFG